MATKFCKKCNQETEKKRGDCMRCAWVYNAVYRAAHIEQANASNATYRASNKDKASSACALWRRANPDRVKANGIAWRAKNQEKVRTSGRIYNQNRRALKRANSGRISKGLAEKLFKLQRGLCACGCRQRLGDDYHLDHRMPLALGGANEDWNIQLLTATCNFQKHAKHPVDFMQSRGYLL